MLKSKAIRKIFITTLSMFVLLIVYSLPNLDDSYTLRTNLEIESATGLYTNNLYLLNSDGYLVKSKILLEGSNLEDKVSEILKQLTIQEENHFPKGLFPYIPKGTKVLNVYVEKDKYRLIFLRNF